jgi:virginiamycin B lyase
MLKRNDGEDNVARGTDYSFFLGDQNGLERLTLCAHLPAWSTGNKMPLTGGFFMKTLVLVIFPLLMSLTPESALGNDVIDITEWRVPWQNTRPRDPFVDSRNRVWFVGQTGDYIAYLDPSTGKFERFDLEQGTGPHNLVVDGNGQIWFAGNLKAYIGKLDRVNGKVTQFPMSHPDARDPHTLVLDRKGDIWFTVQWGNFVGKFITATGEHHLIPVPTPRARPYGIVVDAQNRPWFVEVGSYKLGTVDPKTMTLKEIPLPREASRPRRLGVTSDGNVWYVDYALGFLGRLDPATGVIREWPTPGGTSASPCGVAGDHRDRIWFVECGPNPNRFVGFDPEKEKFFSITEIQSGAGTVRHMFFEEQSKEIWFGTDANTIGRARVP